MAVIISFGFYVIFQGTGNSSGSLVVSPNITSTTKKNSNSTQIIPVIPVVDNSSPSPSPKNPPPVAVIPKKTGLYNDGSYTGPSVDAYYGNVQVMAVISGGKLVDVQFLDYPQDRGNSVRINNRALPILKQEAIQAQSANVNGVSGASETSPAFVKSLTGALNQAKA